MVSVGGRRTGSLRSSIPGAGGSFFATDGTVSQSTKPIGNRWETLIFGERFFEIQSKHDGDQSAAIFESIPQAELKISTLFMADRVRLTL
jgi:hypothetical protein